MAPVAYAPPGARGVEAAELPAQARSSAWALIAAAFGVGSVLGNVTAIHLHPERPLVVAYLLCIASTPSLVLLGFAAPAPAIAAAELVAGLCIGVSGVLYETTLQQQVPREAFGRVASWDWMGSTALRPIGLAVAGPLAAAVGTRAVLVGGAAVTVASLLCLVAVPEVRSMRAGGTGAEAVVTPFVGEEPLPEDQALEM